MNADRFMGLRVLLQGRGRLFTCSRIFFIQIKNLRQSFNNYIGHFAITDANLPPGDRQMASGCHDSMLQSIFFFSTINYGSKAAGLKCGVEGYWDQWMHYSNDCVISLWLRTVTDLAALAEDEGRCDRAHLPNSVEMGSGMMRKTVGHRCCQSHCSGYQLRLHGRSNPPLTIEQQ